MSTFVYSPGVKVYIDSYKLGAIVDVSDSLTGCGMQRRGDGVSQFQFALSNPLRKYDNVFTPNDRLVVVMKRLTWMRTLTGYLNQVPVFSSWPRDVNLSASCSLKRLQYFFWDPAMAASQELVRNSLRLQSDGTAPDGGIKQAVINLLEEVVDWSGAQVAHDKRLAGTKVHIGGIPANWFDFAAKIAKSVAENVEQEAILAAQMLASLGAGASLSGQPLTGTGEVPVGTGGLTSTQAGWAKKVLDVVFGAGGSQRDAEVAIGCCLQESNLLMYANSRLPESMKIPHDAVGKDHLSVGLFQQQAGPGFSWGSVAECMNVEHSTKKFLEVLRAVHNRDSLPFTTVIQKVQRSAYPNAYAKWEAPSKAIVAAYVKNLNVPTLGSDSNYATNTGTAGSAANFRSAEEGDKSRQYTLQPAGPGTTNAEDIVRVAQQVCQKPIRYNLGGDSPYDAPDPTVLDCSSFIQWVYYHALGSINGMPRNSQDQYDWAISHGGKAISVEQASKTPGAVLFRSAGQSRIHHVEISLGGGNRSIGAHSSRSNPQVGETTYGASYYQKAVLLPAVHYPANPAVVAATGDTQGAGSNGATGSAFVQAALQSTGSTAEFTDILQNGSEIDSLFGSVPWENAIQADSSLSDSLVGIRALSNDTPILPYIKNLMNATMRSFCSAPNGDFIGWFPDYYGIWGTAAKMVLQPIEVRDFTVDWSDEYLTTHQFVSPTNDGGQQIDLSSGEVSAISVLSRTESTGIATIDQPGIMAALFGLDQTPDEARRFTQFVYERFGPRPNYTEVPGVTGPKGEFFLALFMFMQNWTAQFNANIDITFMPELFPGMLIQFPAYNFQAYVAQVDHTIAFGPGGGFKTRINITAPARIKDLGGEDRLIGLPVAGAGGRPLPNIKADTKHAAKSSPPPQTKAKRTAVNAKLDRSMS